MGDLSPPRRLGEIRAAMTSQRRTYTCPMHPDVRQPTPGFCPKCGMALEPVAGPEQAPRTEYVCPMHPQIVRDAPGSCPICGMALEPRTVTGDEENAELRDMSRRFWVSVALSVPLLVFVMGDMLPGQPLRHGLSSRLIARPHLVLATPVVLDRKSTRLNSSHRCISYAV